MRNFFLGVGLGLVVVSCANFPYTVYVPDFRNGILKARDPKDDLPASSCDETRESKANCYLMLRVDYIKLRKDYLDMQTRLKNCKANLNPSEKEITQTTSSQSQASSH